MEEESSSDSETENQLEDLYSILRIKKTATNEEIRKAYYRLALQFHPDRNPNDSNATQRFQEIGRAYEILSNEEKRKLYDQTGSTDAEDLLFSNKTGKEWEEYWRALFQKISVDDINLFLKVYKNSTEEQQDLIQSYKKLKGNMKLVLDSVTGAEEEDLPRFIDIINNQIKNGKVENFPAFKKSCDVLLKNKDKRKLEREIEAKEAQKLAEKMGLGTTNDESSLQMAILSKNRKGKTKQEQSMDSLISKIQSKYTPRMGNEPSEEDFQKARERLEERKKQNVKTTNNKRKRN